MRFLLIGKLTPAVAAAIVRHGHHAATPESLGLTDESAKDQILNAATKGQLDLVTADADIAESPYALDFYFQRTIIYLQDFAGGDVEQDDAIDRLFGRYKRLTPKRLYTVTENRVKVRQLPGAV